ncbi:nucleotidyltransferase domain-containing protein [Candidatus Latescibacterota bacterium]
MDPNILSIIIYGSHARKDHDASSDFDLCILTKERQNHELNHEEIKEATGLFEAQNLNLVCYPDSVVDSMLKYGSLFLWHLKLEGKILYGEDYFTNKVRKLKQFKTHYEEIIYHLELFQDLLRSWIFLSIPNELDLSIMFTLSRNACMVLSHKAGKPSFGRLSSFSATKELFADLPMTIDEYLYLSNWKIIYERDCDSKHPLPNADEYKKILSAVEGLLHYALNKTA